MQHEITKEIIIPDINGTIPEPGYSRSEIINYERKNIHAPWFRKKEWDYYLFCNDHYGFAFTISDLGYIGLLSVSIIDFDKKWEHTQSELALFPGGKKFGLGAMVKDGDASCHTKNLDMAFSMVGNGRTISCEYRNFYEGKTFSAELEIKEPDMEAMYIVTPWAEKKTAFYYNCKYNCLEATGVVKFGDEEIRLESGEYFGCLDWGRGVWTYDNTWLWGTGSFSVNNELCGFNIGYGFSDRSSASENCFYYKNRIHKLENVDFGIPKDENGKYKYMDEWHVTDDQGRMDCRFEPIIDRSACMDFKVIISDQHQVYGRLSGTFKMDDGEVVEFKNKICALEVVRNKY